MAEKMFQQTSFTTNTIYLAFINFLDVSGGSGNNQAYKNKQKTAS